MCIPSNALNFYFLQCVQKKESLRPLMYSKTTHVHWVHARICRSKFFEQQQHTQCNPTGEIWVGDVYAALVQCLDVNVKLLITFKCGIESLGINSEKTEC